MTAANLQICVGLQQTGKTHHLDWMLEQVHAQPGAPHALVVDGNCEWPIRPLRRRAIVARTMQAALKEIATEQLVFWQPAHVPSREEVAELATAIRGQGRILVLPEAHRYVPSGKSDHIPQSLQDIILSSRHSTRTALWGDTQFFSNVQRQFIAGGTCHIFGQTAEADLERITKMVSREVADLAAEAARRAAETQFGGDDEPGWHVTVHPLNRVPGSFRLRRT